MKKMLFMLFTILVVTPAYAGPTWLTDLPQAAGQAANARQLLLLDFTGSDWCGWCMKLDEEIFSRPEFINYAKNNVVLVQVDFPMHKPQPDQLKRANRALKKKYGVHGFPTVLIIKPNGKVLWSQEGYVEGGAGPMIDALNQCRKAAGLPAPVKPVPVAAAAPAKIAPAASLPIQKPAAPPQRAGDEPKLQGILYSNVHASVVLDGKTCDEGESVHGMRVLKIARDNVTVEYQGQIEVLRLKENEGQITVLKRN